MLAYQRRSEDQEHVGTRWSHGLPAAPPLAGGLKRWLWQALTRFLDQPVADYELKVPNPMPRLYRELRKGDVVLVDGERRLSRLVKCVTQSQWSHCALYVGDELLRRGERFRKDALARFGRLADTLVVEALIDEGVVAVPLAKYQGHNLRICRGRGIAQADLDRVIDTVIGDLGKRYDVRNFVDLAVALLSPLKTSRLAVPTPEACVGGCTDLAVICSAMIARAFHGVGYPILPPTVASRHHSQILPRDFDLSPHFDIVKFDPREGLAARQVLEGIAGHGLEPPKESSPLEYVVPKVLASVATWWIAARRSRSVSEESG